MEGYQGLSWTTADEEWRSLDWIGDYRVSNMGRVWSGVTKRFLTGTPCKGYMNVRLPKKLYPIHRLVCIAFHGEPAAGMMAGHLDGTRTNNRADNLAWITRSENTIHSMKHGTYNSAPPPPWSMLGEAHPKAILKEADVTFIRRSIGEGACLADLARSLGVSKSIISDIKRRKSWRHVE